MCKSVRRLQILCIYKTNSMSACVASVGGCTSLKHHLPSSVLWGLAPRWFSGGRHQEGSPDHVFISEKGITKEQS